MNYRTLRTELAKLTKECRSFVGWGYLPLATFVDENAPEFAPAIRRALARADKTKAPKFGPELNMQRAALEGAGGYCPRCSGFHVPIPCMLCRHGEDRAECEECHQPPEPRFGSVA